MTPDEEAKKWAEEFLAEMVMKYGPQQIFQSAELELIFIINLN